MHKSLLLPVTLLLGLWAQSAAAVLTRVEFSGEFDDYGSGTFSGIVEYDSDQTSGFFSFVDASASAGTMATAEDTTPVAVGPMSFDGGALSVGPDLWKISDFVDDDVTGFIGSRILGIRYVDGFNPAGGDAIGFEVLCTSFLCNMEGDNTLFRSGTGTYTASVPEPATLGMLGMGLLGLGVMRRKRAA